MAKLIFFIWGIILTMYIYDDIALLSLHLGLDVRQFYRRLKDVKKKVILIFEDGKK